MAQMGFFDRSDRYASLGGKKDPLVEIDAVVPWEEFRPALERVWRKPDADRKSRAGRRPMDAVLMFKTLVLSALYNLSVDQIEYQVRDRLSFLRFLGLGLGDRVPDAKTVWLYRDALGAKRARWRSCSGCSTAILRGRARLRGAVRSSTPPSCRCRATTTRARKMRRLKWRSARGVEGQTRQAMPERSGRPLDDKARQEPLRHQEPRECGPHAQAG